MAGNLRKWWFSVSIKSKMLIFITMIVFMVLFITLFSIGTISSYLRDFNVLLGDSYAVNRALESFETENDAFIVYATQRTAENEAAYAAAKDGTAQRLAGLRSKYGEVNIQRYLLTRAILISHEVYVSRCEKAVGAEYGSGEFIEEYYGSLRIARYLSGYIQSLMDETLDEGIQDYNRKVEQFRVMPVTAGVLASVILMLAVMLGVMAGRHIISPVIRLSRAAGEIAENHLDIPDISVENHDEIGYLVQSFNFMKHSMAQSIASLREASEIKTRLHAEEMHRVKTEQEMQAMQISMLQSQINPHFLFNTFNTIRITAKIECAKRTEELIQRLSNLFRYNLQTESEKVTLSRELNIIRDYIYIQKQRFGHRLDFCLDCGLDAESVAIPTFTLQPLVENAIIHGLAPKEDGGHIRIRVRGCGEDIRITVTDNGLGISKKRMETLMDSDTSYRGHLSGIGVGNVCTRIKMLYPGSRFSMRSRVGMGTSVSIMIPKEDCRVQDSDR